MLISDPLSLFCLSSSSPSLCLSSLPPVSLSSSPSLSPPHPFFSLLHPFVSLPPPHPAGYVDLDNTTLPYSPHWSFCPIPQAQTEASAGTQGITCSMNKSADHSSLLLTFTGNMKLAGCQECCMRWFFTINGEECTDPAPIDAVIYSVHTDQMNMHRGSTIQGVCRATAGGTLVRGAYTAALNVGRCPGFNTTFITSTGYDSTSSVVIEELPVPGGL